MKVGEQPHGAPGHAGRPRATAGKGASGTGCKPPRYRTDSRDTAPYTNSPRRARVRGAVPGSGRHAEKARRSDSASAPGFAQAAALRRRHRRRTARGMPAVVQSACSSRDRARPESRKASRQPGLVRPGRPGPGAIPEGPWRGNQAHGRIECRLIGNGDATTRTRRRSKALKLAASRSFDRFAVRSPR
jgi:hypothetical protein